MLSKKVICMLSTAALVASVSPVMAGTKAMMNLVPWADTDPPANPKVGTKSFFKLLDKGKLLGKLKDVTDAGGALVTTSTTFKDSLKAGNPTLDGQEYIIIVKVHALGYMDVAGNVGIDAEIVIPVDLVSGTGITSLDMAGLFGLITGQPQQIGVLGAEVWGPLGAGNVANCQVIVSGGNPPLPAYITTPNDPSCRGGTQIGQGGLQVPAP